MSAYGDVYSFYSNKKLKHNVDIDGYHRVDIHGRHIKIHKLVYITWIGKIDKDLQVNHKDDNKDNNYYKNLYLGTQKENIHDCMRNNHRVGNMKMLIIYDKSNNETLTFNPASEFYKYCGHTQANGNISRMFTRKWFMKGYDLIYYGKGVTTIESIANEKDVIMCE